MTAMRVAVMTGPKEFEIVTESVPEPGPGQVVVRVHRCGICGSDLHFYKGEAPARPRMRMGHEISGEVARVGQGVSNVTTGRPVTIEPLVVCRQCIYCRTGREHLCLERKLLGLAAPGGFAEYVEAPAYLVHPLPDRLDFEVGSLVEPLAVAVHGLRKVGLEFGERVCVLGSGTIGLMAQLVARALGASDVFATARYPHQAEAARAMGASYVAQAGENAVAELMVAFGGRQPDVVVETVGGSADTINEAIAVSQPGGRVSILGIFSQAPQVNAFQAVIREVALVGGIFYGHTGGRSDFGLALEIARHHADDMRMLITHHVKLDAIGQGFATAADKSQRSIKVTVEV